MTKHGEEAKVAFTGYVARTLNTDPATGQPIPGGRRYYRMNFTDPNDKTKTASVRSDENLSGKAGIVMFVKAGEKTPQGTVVAQDAWTLKSICNASDIATAKAALTALTEIEL